VSVDAVKAPWILEFEDAIRSLRDVHGVSLRGEGDEVREVHILTTSRRPAKQIVRDVQTLLLTRFERSIDHRIVSVAYADPSDPAPRPAAAVPQAAAPAPAPAPVRTMEPVPVSEEADRVRFESANVYVSGARVQAQVELRWKGTHRLGSASGWSTRGGAQRLLAAATLAAVQEFLDDDLALSLEDVSFRRIGRHRAAIVGVELLAHRESKSLVGACTVGGDAQQAVVLATLSALNRVVGGLRMKGPADLSLRPTQT